MPPISQQVGLGLRVLFVEDNEEIREALASVLESEGYEITPAPSAEEGLERLRAGTFHLVITDYSLPHMTGAWLLQHAEAEGLLTNTAAMVVTAHPNPAGVGSYRLIRKPLDLDDFLREIEKLLAPMRVKELERARETFERSAPGISNSERVELALYINSTSPSSLRAVRNLQRLMGRYHVSQVRLTVHDLNRELPPEAEEDRIAFTPTLVKRSPGPRSWVLGHLDNVDVVTELLSLAGVEPRT